MVFFATSTPCFRRCSGHGNHQDEPEAQRLRRETRQLLPPQLLPLLELHDVDPRLHQAKHSRCVRQSTQQQLLLSKGSLPVLPAVSVVLMAPPCCWSSMLSMIRNMRSTKCSFLPIFTRPVKGEASSIVYHRARDVPMLGAWVDVFTARGALRRRPAVCRLLLDCTGHCFVSTHGWAFEQALSARAVGVVARGKALLGYL